LAILGVSRADCGWVAIRVGLAGSETPPGVSLTDLRGVGVSFTAPRAALSPPRGPEGWETGNGMLFAVPLAMVGLGQVAMGVGSCVVRFLEWGRLGAGSLSLELLLLLGRVGMGVGTCVVRFLEWGRLGAGSLSLESLLLLLESSSSSLLLVSSSLLLLLLVVVSSSSSSLAVSFFTLGARRMRVVVGRVVGPGLGVVAVRRRLGGATEMPLASRRASVL
jgi:hypothetical protein